MSDAACCVNWVALALLFQKAGHDVQPLNQGAHRLAMHGAETLVNSAGKYTVYLRARSTQKPTAQYTPRGGGFGFKYRWGLR